MPNSARLGSSRAEAAREPARYFQNLFSHFLKIFFQKFFQTHQNWNECSKGEIRLGSIKDVIAKDVITAVCLSILARSFNIHLGVIHVSDSETRFKLETKIKYGGLPNFNHREI